MDPNKIEMCVAGHMYRVNNNMWPIPKDAVSVGSLQNANLATNDGDYSWNLSGCVSEKKRMQPGNYIIVPSTFEGGSCGQWNLIVYHGAVIPQFHKYEHSA